jgi:hypothetical protein
MLQFWCCNFVDAILVIQVAAQATDHAIGLGYLRSGRIRAGEMFWRRTGAAGVFGK